MTSAMEADGWKPVQRVRSHEQVMDQIESRILDGRLQAGDRLPSEREFAILVGVGRPALRESLRVLEALGIVDIRRGQDGGATLVGTPGDAFIHLLRLQLALGHFAPDEVLDTRIALESWSCRQAADRSTAEDHTAMAKILDAMDAPDVEVSEFNRLDAAFHVRIAESTGNSLLAHLMTGLRAAINRQMIEAYAGLPDWRETARTVREEHRKILDAIVNRAPDRAAELVQQHIRSFYASAGL